MKKVFLSLSFVFGIFSACFGASNATDVYLLAQTKSTAELKAIENIDVVDLDGNTALCSAIKDNNIDAYNLLKKAGANTEHKCVKKIPAKQYQAFTQKLAATNKSWSFLGLGKWAWSAIGLGVAGGAVAAGMGGGSGSSDTNSNHSPNFFELHLQEGWSYEPCQEGYYAYESAWGWAGTPGDSEQIWMYKCVPNNCPYTTTECAIGYVTTGENCQSGETIYVKCEPDTCEGFNYTNVNECPLGYTVSDSCLSGGITKYKCETPATCPYSSTECTGGYVATGGQCKSGETTYVECEPIQCGVHSIWSASGCTCENGYQNWTPGIGCYPASCGANATQSGTECECNDGYQNWQNGIGCSLIPIDCGVNATQQGTQCQCNDGYQNWQSGIGCSLTPIECGANAHQDGTQCQCDDGYQNWQSGIGCSLTPIDCGINATQQGTQCVCDSGFTQWTSGYGCYAELDCGVHATQQGNQCQCDSGYTQWTEGYGCYIIRDCGINAHQAGIMCMCDDGYTDMGEIGCVTRIYYVSIDGQEYNIQNDNDYNLKVVFTGIADNSSTIYDNTNNTVQKTLNIINHGDGDISFSHDYLTQATLYETSVLDLSRTANGTLYLENTGHGTIYGLSGKTYYGYEGANSRVVLDIDSGVSGSRVQSDSLLKIKNIGNGDVYGMYGKNMTNADMTGTVSSSVGIDAVSNGTINIENHGNGNVYGIYDPDETLTYSSTIYNAYSDAQVTPQYNDPITVNGTIIISNDGDGDVYGMYSHHKLYGATTTQQLSYVTANSVISITNSGNGNVYGMYSDSIVVPAGLSSSSYISVHNNGNGNAYGIYAPSSANSNTGLFIKNSGTGTAYGFFGGDISGIHDNIWEILNLSGGIAFAGYGWHINNKNTLKMYNITNGDIIGAAGDTIWGTGEQNYFYNLGTGWVIGAYGQSTDVSNIHIYRQEVNLVDLCDLETNYNYAPSSNIGGTAIGGYATSSLVASGPITISKASTAYGVFGDTGASMQVNATSTSDNAIEITDADLAVGIYVGENGSLTNAGKITIANATNAYGIYAGPNSNVTNSGNITITNSTNAYGIYAEEGATISNTGIISVNGSSCNGSQCNGSETYSNNIVLNGASLINSGTITAKILDLDALNGNILAGAGARFIVENELSGDLNISSDIVAQGNQTTYIAENMIDAGDVSGLNIRSASAMFNASLADNGHDVVMQMKDFNELTDNASLAAFLANNYANGNGSDLFATLKSMENMSAFNGTLAGLTGLNTFTQFAHEDLSAMREISFSMNNKLFENSNRDSFDISDSTGYFSFSNSHNGGNGQYGISSEKVSDNWKLGYGMAMANINTGDGDSMHRQNNLWLFYMPATYTNDGYELVVAPKAGFAHSEYNRRGYNNINYEGYIEKRIFGLMNDLRYPLTFGNWTFAPDLAFNTIVYEQSGREDEQAFSLIIPDDRTISVETGLGFYTKYEKQLSNGGKFKLNSGLMVYREFGDTYNIKLGIRGMDGTFNLYNNDYKYRGAASVGFDYTLGYLHLYGNAQYFMDNDNYMNFKSGVSYRF